MREIPLTQGKIALVDDADFERVNAHKWYAQKRGSEGNVIWYAYRRFRVRKSAKWGHIAMHKFLTGYKLTDHADNDGLNNQRENLRQVTDAQNCFNRRKIPGTSSRFKGVYKDPTCARWRAAIRINGKTIRLGYFRDEVDAAQAYNFAAEEHFGEFAWMNTPETGLTSSGISTREG